MQTRDDIYTRVTNQIIDAIEDGTKKWRMPWHITEADCFSPVNAVSRRPYRGINVLVLWTVATSKGYPTGWWATYEQWKQLGAQVRKGEKAAQVVLWKPTERIVRENTDDATKSKDRTKRGLIARGFSVFNAAQVEGYEVVRTPKLFENARIRTAERVLFGAGVDVRHGGATAFYNSETDFIAIPRLEAFRDSVSYYAILAHELTHATAAPHRLGRQLGQRFGTKAYAAEELIAELAARGSKAFSECGDLFDGEAEFGMEGAG